MRIAGRYCIYPESHGHEVSVFSWNVLAPLYSSHCIDWRGIRLPALKRWLQMYASCDILCFQEVDLETALAEISSVLDENGFIAVIQDRQRFPVVNATFFKASRLRLVWTQHRSRALVVGLAFPDGRQLSVANVHLEAGGHENNEKQRNAQLASVLKRVHGPTVVCGDFNSCLAHESPLRVQLAKAGLVRAPTKGITLAQTCGYADVLDHIWASECLRAVLVLGSSSEALAALKSTGMPDETHPSDHLPVAATFCFMQNSHCGHLPQNVAAVEAPSVPGEEMRQEWVRICRCAEFDGGKRAAREQRQLEAAFLELLSHDEAANLKQWRDAATKAAKDIVATVVAKVIKEGAGDLPSAAESFKAFDPGGNPERGKSVLSVARGDMFKYVGG